MLLLSMGKVARSALAYEGGDALEKGIAERVPGALVLHVTGALCPFTLTCM
jgi:hypothetical protein